MIITKPPDSIVLNGNIDMMPYLWLLYKISIPQLSIDVRDLNYDRRCSSLENGVIIYAVPMDANTAIGDSALGLFPI